ncbi:MAG: UDP-4-amino-4-deoxy-L-arabinose--oxoglutarate aminotransferase [candidate division WS6 bacterium OLB20]|uniref:UDP-4-amino-4-deoxy-L-arabinose--oxoglutarate aminotransferase n=1 Tax=candidate division WS6 bacterium OLB20 TaxID=1617426 RepID=A0A136LZ98_9BACT|nr:MAG: UDP-4-amino-4-deoxy-L-arabinose--oxoglutarate aminotransferase [candidate division WS6 bacterium OLB20]
MIRSRSPHLKSRCRIFFDGADTVALDSARSAFYLILQSYGVGPGDEVILPAFTCLVVANPVIWLGATPVYVDTDDNFNINLIDLKSKVSERTRAILVQHTFGMPADVEAVKEITGPGVKIIEDLAHTLGGTLRGRKLGLLGDAAILTFGIEKAISTVRGGMVLTRDTNLVAQVRASVASAPRFSRLRVLLSLTNPVFWSIVTPVYYLGIGKLTAGRILTWIAHRFGMLGNMIEDEEYRTVKPSWFPAQMPGALARLGIRQFSKLRDLNAHRRIIAAVYSRELGITYETEGEHNYLRFPVLVNDQQLALQQAKKNHVVIGDWYKTILYAPEGTLERFRYQTGSAPKAELYAKHIVNLPTSVNVTPDDAVRIARFIKPNLWISK